MNNGRAGSNKGDARNPSGQGNVEPGTDNNTGKNSGGKYFASGRMPHANGAPASRGLLFAPADRTVAT
jgi:hypothetical protein